jgi:hypothetical protein
MANLRRYTNQFMNSFERNPVMLMGSASQTGSVGSFATLTSNGITYTADRMGDAGNDITIEIVGGGTAGAEVVTVLNSLHIKVVIESGVSTRTQVKTALDNSAAAAALISVSVSSGGTAASLLAQTNLATGADTPISMEAQAFTVAQIGTGIFEISANTPMANLLSASIMLQRSSAVDLMAQIQSVSASSRKIVFRMQAGATPTDMASGDVLYIQLVVRPSANA